MKLINNVFLLTIILQFSVKFCIAQKVDSIVNAEIKKALSLNTKAISLRSDAALADTVFNNLYKSYSGPLREELLMNFLLLDFHTFNYGIWLDIARKYVNEPENRRVLDRLYIARKTGTRKFPIRLVDTSGNKISVSDFAGKVVVIETWFTGCTPCEYLSQTMRPIADSLTRLQKDIVFISLNVSDSLWEWKGSISDTGKFYSPSSHHYKVQNEQDFLDTFRYIGHPHLLIFGKNGKMISSNAPRPLDQSPRSREIFMTVLNKELAAKYNPKK